MSANGGVGIRMVAAWITPWFYSHKSGFCIKTKHPMHLPQKVGFSPPLGFATWFKIVCFRKQRSPPPIIIPHIMLTIISSPWWLPNFEHLISFILSTCLLYRRVRVCRGNSRWSTSWDPCIIGWDLGVNEQKNLQKIHMSLVFGERIGLPM